MPELGYASRYTHVGSDPGQIRHANDVADGMHKARVVRLLFVRSSHAGEYAPFIKRLDRDEQMIAELEAEVVKFLQEVSATVETLTRKYGGGYDTTEITDEVRLMMAG